MSQEMEKKEEEDDVPIELFFCEIKKGFMFQEGQEVEKVVKRSFLSKSDFDSVRGRYFESLESIFR